MLIGSNFCFFVAFVHEIMSSRFITQQFLDSVPDTIVVMRFVCNNG